MGNTDTSQGSAPAEKRSEVFTFRPTPDVRRTIDAIRGANLNVSQAINSALEKALEGVAVQMAREMEPHLAELLDRKKTCR